MDIAKEQDIESLRQLAIYQKHHIEILLSFLQKKCSVIDALRGTQGDFQKTLAQIKQRLQPLRPSSMDKAKETSSGEDAPSPPDEPEPPSTPPPPDDLEEEPPDPPEPRKGHGPKSQPRLTRNTKVYELDEPDCVCTLCGQRLHVFEGQTEQSEMITVIEVQYILQDVHRQKYVCENGCGIETAPGPDRAIEGGRYALEFAVHVAAAKYATHMPLDRLAMAMIHRGLDVTATTLWDQIDALAHDLKRAFRALKESVLDQDVIGVDQTSWPCLEKSRPKPWQMWGLISENGVIYAICNDKSEVMMRKLLGDMPRFIVCDMMLAHLKFARETEGILLAACWAHALRRFRDALPDFPQAAVAMRLIKELYEIDDFANSLEEKAELRKTQSRMVLDELKEFLEHEPILLSTSYGSAVNYVLEHWEYFICFLKDPRIPLDNNWTERSFKGPIVGRKNHYGSKSERGTEVAELFYSLIETAKLIGVDPTEYLIAAAKAGRRGEALLPQDMVK